MAINYKQAKVFLRGMICLSEYEAEAIDIAIKAIDACINNKYDIITNHPAKDINRQNYESK